jgi:hypothetical protein
MSSAPEKTESGNLNLSVTQIVAGALAAVSSAVAASYFGVAGTLLGAALGSVIGTVGTAVYKASLARTKDKLQEIVPIQTVVLRTLGDGSREDAAADDAGGEPAGTETVTVAGGMAAPGHPATLTGDLASTPTDLPGGTEVARGAGTAGDPDVAPSGGPGARPHPPRHWKRLAVVAATAFALSIGIVGAVEAAAGQSLTSLLPGGDQKKRDDTLLKVVTPGSTRHHTTPSPAPTVTPMTSPTATPSGTAPPSVTATPSATATPSGTPGESVSRAPSPSLVPSPPLPGAPAT